MSRWPDGLTGEAAKALPEKSPLDASRVTWFEDDEISRWSDEDGNWLLHKDAEGNWFKVRA